MVITSINPATLEKNGEVDETSVGALDGIFARAREVQQVWKKVDVCDRARVVVGVNRYLVDHIDEISLLICREVGKPPLEAFISEVYTAIDGTFYYYTIARDVLDRKASIDLRFYNSMNKNSHVIQKPAGVVAVIGPFNYPLLLPFHQIVQSLMAGNAVVFKPSSDTVLVGKMIQDAFNSVKHMPAGLFTTVFGSGGTVGNAIVDRADRVVFTGSTETGKAIMRKAADRLTPVCLELGGKEAMVVLPDANLDRAILAARWGCFFNSGQVCSSVKRLYLHESIKKDFLSRLVKMTRSLKQSYPEEPGVDIGAMVNEVQMNKVLQAIERAKSEGARVLCGGRRNPALKGYFIEPTILDGCTNRMRCVQEEIFGPVLVVIPFHDEAEAIRMVNDNPYGLASSVWTSDIDRGVRLGTQIETGNVMVNEVVYTVALAATPWGGAKVSGIGRSHGDYGFLEASYPMHVNVDTSTEPDPWWTPYDTRFVESMENFRLVCTV
jgi:acyl-CoA reductase-like NAD-dependent aldehyde dehydrogenase